MGGAGAYVMLIIQLGDSRVTLSLSGLCNGVAKLLSFCGKFWLSGWKGIELMENLRFLVTCQ